MSQRPVEIKALSGARAFPPLILVLFHFCEGHGYRGMSGEVCRTDWWHYFFVCSKWFDLPVGHGYLWVEFFFALSGFVLIHSYGHKAREMWKLSAYLGFIKARLARLYPVHVVTLLSMLVLMLVLNQLADWGGYTSIYHQPWGPVNSFGSFITNLLLIQAWNISDSLTWNGASWFVSVLFLLALLFPVIVTLSRARWWLGVALIGLGLSWLTLLAVNSGTGIDLTFRDGMFRGMANFGAGVGLAMIYRDAKQAGIDKLPDWVFHAAQSAALIFLYWATYETGWSHTVNDVWSAAAFYVLILVIAFDRGFLAKGFSAKLPMKLGEWSYGVYMGQTFWLQAVRYFEMQWYPPDNTMIFGIAFHDWMWWSEPVLLLLVCIAWGWLLTRYVEKPAAAWIKSLPGPGKAA